MDFYSEISPYYDKITRIGYMNYSKVYNDLKKLIKGKKILELGVGTGNLTKLLTKGGFDVTGIEVSKPMFKIAKKRLAGTKVKLFLKDIINFKKKENFDTIISHASIFVVIKSKEGLVIESYITNKRNIKRALENIYNSLKEEGIFIFDFYPEHNPSKRGFKFGKYKYWFEIKQNKGMWDFIKINHIQKGDKIIATSKIHKIRLSRKEFENISLRIGFKSMKTRFGKYIILEK